LAIPPLENNLPAAEPDISVNRLIIIGLVTRLVTDTAVQIFFPFLPVFAAGLRTTTVAAGRLVSLRSAMGLLSPAFGALADQRGYRFTMRLGLLLGAIGYFIVGLSSSLGLAALGMVLGGLGTFSFVPTLQAYLSARLPFHRRARGLGTLEYAWALAGIIGLYLAGLLIEAYSWRVPMFILGGLMLVAFVWYGRLPAARQANKTKPAMPTFSWKTARDFFDLGDNWRSAWAVLVVAGMNMMAAMVIFLNYGTWLAREYSLGAAWLGTVALILGLADLTGSVLVSLIGDKLGLRRSVYGGIILVIIGYALLPVFNQGIVLAVVGLIIARFAFEFTVVGLIALVSEQAPAYRGKIMTMAAAAVLLGSTLAGLFGPWVYDQFGVLGLAVASAGVMAVSLLLLHFWVQDRAGETA
jgi:predicted MFS family arabinose efflux permease